jgi:cyanate permease
LSIYWGLLTWAPKYLAEARGFDPAAMGLATGGAFLAAAVATGVAGLVVDRLPRRAPVSAVMLVVCAVALCAAAVAPGGTLAALAIAIGLSARAFASPNLFAILQRIVPQRVIAAGAGVDNGVANLGSALMPTAIGLSIAITGEYAAGIVLLGVLAMVGAAAMGVLALRRY